MLLFPNTKINIGLRITSRRTDGYHNIESLMLPVAWCDILEYHPAHDSETDILSTGDSLPDCAPADNLVVKALNALRSRGYEVPAMEMILEKHIPSQAGLGGGSADAAFILAAVGHKLGLTKQQICEIAARVGADCPFFVHNRPMYATGTGTTLTPFDVSRWAHLGIAIAKADCAAVSTAQAYAGVTPTPLPEGVSLVEAFQQNPAQWESDGILVNDFEQSVIARLPVIATIKDRFRNAGALYTAMSGSGSAVFALFPTPEAAAGVAGLFGDCQFFSGTLGND